MRRAKNCHRGEIDYGNVRTREPTSVNRYDLLSRRATIVCGTEECNAERAVERQHFPSDERAISRMKRTHPFPPADALPSVFLTLFFTLFFSYPSCPSSLPSSSSRSNFIIAHGVGRGRISTTMTTRRCGWPAVSGESAKKPHADRESGRAEDFRAINRHAVSAETRAITGLTVAGKKKKEHGPRAHGCSDHSCFPQHPIFLRRCRSRVKN